MGFPSVVPKLCRKFHFSLNSFSISIHSLLFAGALRYSLELRIAHIASHVLRIILSATGELTQ